MRSAALLLAASIALPPLARARAADTAALTAAAHALQDGVTHANVDAILAARATLAGIGVDHPSAVADYWIALASWCAEPLLLARDRDGARRLLKEGIDASDRAFAADPKFGEALAVKAGLQGLSLTFVPSAAPSLAPEMDESFSRARSLEPKNPRVLLLQGIYLLHKPERFGGGAARAKPLFERAAALEAAQAPDPRGIDWGADDVLLWYGRCLAALGDWAGARERYRAVLALEPDHAWVRDELLPEAERHLAAPADSR